MMKYAFYPGCAAKGACPELYQSARLVAAALGIELVELTGATCTGAGVVQERDPETGLAMNARTFAMAERLGLDVLTICGTCQGVMSQANGQLRGDETCRRRVNGLLAKDGASYQYQGGVQVKHLLWVLLKDLGLDRFKALVTKPFHYVKVAPFYGCYILRPSAALGFDNPDQPTSLETVIAEAGGAPVEYEGKVKCCGFPILLEKEPIATAMAGLNMKQAKEHGADCMVTPCPLCHMSLDIYQGRAERAIGMPLNLPILHFPQLLGLAMGFSPKQLGLHRHLVSADRLLEKLRLR